MIEKNHEIGCAAWLIWCFLMRMRVPFVSPGSAYPYPEGSRSQPSLDQGRYASQEGVQPKTPHEQ